MADEKQDWPYSIQIEVETEGDPPKVYIIDQSGMAVLEVLEGDPPTSPLGKWVPKECFVEWEGEWSWDPDDWEAGFLAKMVVRLLNAEYQRFSTTGEDS